MRAYARVGAVLGLTLAAAFPATAEARYYLTRSEAQSFAKDWAHKRYPGTRTGVYCRPQGAKAAQPGYIYHRWTCTVDFVFSPECFAGVRISGSNQSGSYYSATLFDGCD